MGRAVGGNRAAFLAIRAVDANYPLLGTVDRRGRRPRPLPDLLAISDGAASASSPTSCCSTAWA